MGTKKGETVSIRVSQKARKKLKLRAAQLGLTIVALVDSLLTTKR